MSCIGTERVDAGLEVKDEAVALGASREERTGERGMGLGGGRRAEYGVRALEGDLEEAVTEGGR
jgi:hypothetical protein